MEITPQGVIFAISIRICHATTFFISAQLSSLLSARTIVGKRFAKRLTANSSLCSSNSASRHFAQRPIYVSSNEAQVIRW